MAKIKEQITAQLNITSFRGCSVTAKHYYGTLHMLNGESIELMRPITADEIEQDNDRFYYYEPGDKTKCFNSWRDVITAADSIIKQKGLAPYSITVNGIPNTDSISFNEALKPIDTRPKCKLCGKVINTGAGCYNTPNGLFCVTCYGSRKRK